MAAPRAPGLRIVVGLGVQKSGTTSLYESLVDLSQLFEPGKHKECHYFENRTGHLDNYTRKCFHYRYRSDRYQLDISPRYFNSVSTVANMMRVSVSWPHVFLLLRDPVDRAVSGAGQIGLTAAQFERDVRWAHARTISCERHLYSDMVAFQRCTHATLGTDLYRRGLYAAWLDHWGRYFARNQVHVYASDDLFSSYGATVARIVRDMTGVKIGTGVAVRAVNSKSERVAVNGSLRDYLSGAYRAHNLKLKCRFPNILPHTPWIARSGKCTDGSMSPYRGVFVDTSGGLDPPPRPSSPPPGGDLTYERESTP